MSVDELKLIFDECLGEAMMLSLRPYLQKSGIKVTLAHIVTYQKAGVKDADWIPKIAQEGGWIVVSTDLGKQGHGDRWNEKLPYLCRHHRVTHVLLSSSVHRLKGFEKGQAIVAVWADIVDANGATRGTRFKLRQRARANGFVLVNADEEEHAIRQRKRAE